MGKIKSKKAINKSESKKFRQILNLSYGEGETTRGMVKDKSLSGKRVTVLNDRNDHKTYVVHRGTTGLRDWFTDFEMALGYEGGRRFKHSQKIQKKAEAKYGAQNIVTMGHSLGGRLAEKFGKNTSNIVTFNKAVTPRSIVESIIKPLPKKQYDVRTTGDVVSMPTSLQRRENNVISINSNTINPIKEHGLSTL
jgi:hypothetical protein